MKFQIVAYIDDMDSINEVVLMEVIIQPVDNWERVLRKMYNWVWKHCNQASVINLFAIMINEEGWNECSQAWDIEYSKHFPNYELPFI